VQGSIYSLFLYDAVHLYMTMMEHIVTEKLDWRNGTFWLNMARNWVAEGQYKVLALYILHVTTLRSGLCYRKSVCRLWSVCRLSVCHDGARYSGG